MISNQIQIKRSISRMSSNNSIRMTEGRIRVFGLVINRLIQFYRWTLEVVINIVSDRVVCLSLKLLIPCLRETCTTHTVQLVYLSVLQQIVKPLPVNIYIVLCNYNNISCNKQQVKITATHIFLSQRMWSSSVIQSSMLQYSHRFDMFLYEM